MTEDQRLYDDLATLLEALPTAQLADLTRKVSLNSLDGLCRSLFRDRNLTDVVATLFPDFAPPMVAEVAKRIGLTAIRNTCLKSMMDVPGQADVRIRSPDVAAARALREHRGPAILAFWHFGPVNMLTIALRHIGVPAIVISRAAPSRWTNAEDLLKMRINITDANPRQAATALRKSLEHMKGGGMVAFGIDGSMGKQDVTVPFLGRRFGVSRGAAGLARITGAPIIPCTMQWEPGHWGMAIRVFDPLPRPDVPPEDAEAFEQAVLAGVARHFEEYGRRHPGQFKIDQLADLIDAPKIEESGVGPR